MREKNLNPGLTRVLTMYNCFSQDAREGGKGK